MYLDYKKSSLTEFKKFMDQKVELYNNSAFIETDPIQIPKSYSRKEDIEISAFIISTIAWGNRTSIINNGNKLKSIWGPSPYDFIINYQEEKIHLLNNFKHRTFNTYDLHFFFLSLKNIYLHKGGLEKCFSNGNSIKEKIISFRNLFLELEHEKRVEKHISNPAKGSAAKRINMFLRWMVRKDNKGVDFGIWDTISPTLLHIPLDVHTGNVARKLNMLVRKQNDWKTLDEIQHILLQLDQEDPSKYDFALFGIGAFE